jgi:hypothetical protein
MRPSAVRQSSSNFCSNAAGARDLSCKAQPVPICNFFTQLNVNQMILLMKGRARLVLNGLVEPIQYNYITVLTISIVESLYSVVNCANHKLIPILGES